MQAKILILVFFIGAALAYPAAEYTEFDETPTLNDVNLLRAKRQFNPPNNNNPNEPKVQLYGGGGGGPRQGYNVDVNSRFPIWQSQNDRSSLHGTVGYSQHIGGPYGNSQPDYRGGLTFTHRF